MEHAGYRPDESQPMIIPIEIARMSQSYVIAAGLRADPDAGERAELTTLYWLNTLQGNMMGGRISGFVEVGRSYQRSFEPMASAPGVTEDERRQMAETFEQVDIFAKVQPILGALSEAGFTRRAEALRAAVALASSENADFAALDAAFGSGEEFADAIVAYVARTPTLAAWAVRVRAELDDDDRLDWLVERLATMSDEARTHLPKALRTIHAVSYFESQIFNGGLHQAFFNSSGDLAPEVAAGLRALGLTAQAMVVEHGISMFSAPYPRDTSMRRNSYFRNGSIEWDNRLAKLGENMDLDAIRPSLIELARREGVLPK